MRTGKTNKSLILVLIAFAIGWFSLYSIINFHQHRIFGEELKCNTYPSLCKKEESIYLIKTLNDKNVYLENHVLFTSSINQTVIFQFYSQKLNFISESSCLVINSNSQERLRAPPSVS